MLGEIVGGRFRIVSVAGQGGSGDVYRARDEKGGAEVALKLLRGDAAIDLERFRREAGMLARLRHPSIAEYIDHGFDGARAFIAMQWLEGALLSEALRSRGKLAVKDAITLLTKLGEALAEAHRLGIVHRDVKPSNVILRAGELADPVLLDFGVARSNVGETLTGADFLIGTPGYMAPEQARADPAIDARADVFALGCILYRALTGRAPFEGEDFVAVLAKTCLEDPPEVERAAPDVPASLVILLEAMLAKDRAERPRDASVVVERLRAIDPADIAQADSASAVSSETISRAEGRFVCVVAARGLLAEPVAIASEPTPATLPTRQDDHDSAPNELRAVVARGGKAARLLDGTTVISFSSAAVPADLATIAVRSAIELCAPEAKLFVASGWGVASHDETDRFAGSAIEQAIAGLADAEPGEVFGDAATARLVGDRIVVNELDPTRVRFGGASSPSRFPRAHSLPFAGRDREMAFLESLFAESMSEESANAVLVLADAGGGKSAVRRRFAKKIRASHPEARLLLGQADPFRRGALALLSALTDITATEDSSADEAPPPSIRAAAQNEAHGTDAKTFSDSTMGGAAQALASPDLAPQLVATSALRAWLDWVEAELAKHPVVLLLEDLHWADGASVENVGKALRAFADRPLFVAGFARTEVRDSIAKSWKSARLAELSLAALSAKTSERLLRMALGSIDAADLASIAARAGGNPFYLVELARIARGKGARDIPATLVGMLQSTFDALGQEATRTLRAGSVFGRTFEPEGVAAVLGSPAPTVALHRHLNELERHGIVRAPEGPPGQIHAIYTFRHDLLRDAAHATLTAADRETGHRLAADWLVKRGDRDALEIADHYAEANAMDRAAPYLAEAAAAAIGAWDLPQARALAMRAIDAGVKSETRVKCHVIAAEAAHWSGDHAPAIDASRAAMAESSSGEAMWYRAGCCLIRACARTGDHEMARVAIASLIDAKPLADAENERVTALAMAAIACARAERVDLGMPLVAVVIAESANMDRLEPAARAQIAAVRAFAASATGQQLTAIAAHEEAARLNRAVNDVPMAAFQELSLSQSLGNVGALNEALSHIQSVLREVRRFGFVNIEGIACWAESMGLSELGQNAEAVASAEKGEAIAIRLHEPALVCRTRASRARALGRSGDIERALALINETSDLARDMPAGVARFVGIARAEVLVMAQKYDLARAELESTARLAKSPFEQDDLTAKILWVKIFEEMAEKAALSTELARARDAIRARAGELRGTKYFESFIAMPVVRELSDHATRAGVSFTFG